MSNMAYKDDPTAATPLNPGMVHQPPSSPLGQQYQGDDGDKTQMSCNSTYLTLILLRVAIFASAIYNLVIQFKSYPSGFIQVSLLVLTFIILFWHVLVTVVPCLPMPRLEGPKQKLPDVGLIIGKWEFLLCGGGNHNGQGRIKKKIYWMALVDLILAVLELIFMLAYMTHNGGWRWTARILAAHAWMSGLAFLVFFAQLLPELRFTIHHIPDDEVENGSRIRLPQQPQFTQPSQQHPMSIRA